MQINFANLILLMNYLYQRKYYFDIIFSFRAEIFFLCFDFGEKEYLLFCDGKH